MADTGNDHPEPPLGLVSVDGEAAKDDFGANPWAKLNDAADREAFAESWLEIQCAMLSNVLHAVVLLGAANRGPYAPLASWPKGSRGSPELLAATETSMDGRRAVRQGPR